MDEYVEALIAAKAKIVSDVEETTFSVVGPLMARRFGLNGNRLRSVVAWARLQEGYVIRRLELMRSDQGKQNHFRVKVLTKESTTYQEVWQNRDKILQTWIEAQLTDKN
jgi:hypothetical protein